MLGDGLGDPILQAKPVQRPIWAESGRCAHGRKGDIQRMLAEHLTNEFRVRTVFEWKCPPNVDNHWWDCVVRCAVAASMQGAVLPGTEAKPVQRKRLKLSELQRGRAGR